jgi:hypothetical protein
MRGVVVDGKRVPVGLLFLVPAAVVSTDAFPTQTEQLTGSKVGLWAGRISEACFCYAHALLDQRCSPVVMSAAIQWLREDVRVLMLRRSEGICTLLYCTRLPAYEL